MKRALLLTVLGVSLVALGAVGAFLAPAVAQNVSCYLQQGGNAINFDTGCTWSVDGTSVTASGTELNLIDGVTATTAELNKVDGPSLTSGADPGATCRAGDIFVDTDETVDTNCTTTADNSLCLCTATDVWTALENN